MEPLSTPFIVANTLYKSKKYSEALQLYTSYINQNKSQSNSTQTLGLALIQRSLCFTQLGLHEAALVDAQQALTMVPENPRAHYCSALALLQDGSQQQLQEAAAVCDRALETFDRNNALLQLRERVTRRLQGIEDTLELAWTIGGHSHSHEHADGDSHEHSHEHENCDSHEHSHMHDDSHEHSHMHDDSHEHSHMPNDSNEHSHEHDDSHEHSHEHAHSHEHSNELDHPHGHSHEHLHDH